MGSEGRGGGSGDLKPLKVTCTSTDCEDGLHCFRATRRMRMSGETGRCRSCGADLINWDRVHQQDLQDVNYTFSSLKLEMFRHYYWHLAIDDRALRHAMRFGRRALREKSLDRLRKKIGVASPPFDGRQTPLSGNVIYYGQHGTASCCRKCLEYWHGIPMGRPLSNRELGYLANLVMLYIEDRVPGLPP